MVLRVTGLMSHWIVLRSSKTASTELRYRTWIVFECGNCYTIHQSEERAATCCMKLCLGCGTFNDPVRDDCRVCGRVLDD